MPKPAKRKKRKKHPEPDPSGVTVYYACENADRTHGMGFTGAHDNLWQRGHVGPTSLARGNKTHGCSGSNKNTRTASVLVLGVREGGTLNSIDSDEEDEPIPEMKPNKKTKTTNNRESKKTQTTEKTSVPPKRKKP